MIDPKKSYFLRFTSDIKSDIARGTSLITVQGSRDVADGLCAFSIDIMSIEEGIEKAKQYHDGFYGAYGDEFAIITGTYQGTNNRGDGGVLVEPEEVIYEGRI